MKRRSLLLLPAALAASALLASACGRQDDSLTVVRQRGSLRVALDPSFPPFEMLAGEGSLQGLDVELAQLISAQLGLDLDLRSISFDGLYDALAAGETDVIASALPYDPLRTQDVRYSDPYFEDGVVLIAPPGSSGDDLNAMNGSLAVEIGSEASLLTRQAAEGVTILQFTSEPEVLAAVWTGKAGHGLANKVSACLYRRDGTSLTIVRQVSRTPYCLALRAQDASLGQAVSDALRQVLAGDAWKQAKTRWLGDGC